MGLFDFLGGGGSSTTPSLGDSIGQYIEQLPRLMGATQNIAPQQAQLQLDLLEQFGGPMLGAQHEALSSIFPQTARSGTSGSDGRGMPKFTSERPPTTWMSRRSLPNGWWTWRMRNCRTEPFPMWPREKHTVMEGWRPGPMRV